MQNTTKKISQHIIKNLLLPLFILLLFVAGYVLYKIKWHPIISEALQQNLKKYISTIFIICISFVIQRIVGAFLNWYGQNIATKTSTEFDDKIVPLLRKALIIFIWVIALVIILPIYGINISALIATLGVTSLAIALAAQDTIANIIAGFLILLDVPFRVGDNIQLPSGEKVEVLEIGLRRSRFLSEDKKAIIIVPNLDLSKSKITNYTYGEG